MNSSSFAFFQLVYLFLVVYRTYNLGVIFKVVNDQLYLPPLFMLQPLDACQQRTDPYRALVTNEANGHKSYS